MTKGVQQQTAFIFGAVFIVALVFLAIAFPNPTPFQYTVFRVILALAAAGVAAMIPGFIEVEIPDWLRAGGALSVFVVIYFYNPASLVANVDGDETMPRVAASRFVDDFDSNTPDALQKNGWKIEYRDDALWASDGPAGHLSLLTARGDVWTKPDEPAVVKNMILRTLSANSFQLVARLENFLPLRNWQQAGICIFDGPDHYARLTVGYDDHGLSRPELRVQAVVEYPDGRLQDEQFRIREADGRPIRQAFLRIVRDRNSISFQWSEESNYWYDILRTRMDFTTHEVGLFAFQGITERLADGSLIPLTWDPVQADFDFFRIEPIE